MSAVQPFIGSFIVAANPAGSVASPVAGGKIRLIYDQDSRGIPSAISRDLVASEDTKEPEQIEVVTPVPEIVERTATNVHTAPIQIWEGEVLSIDEKSGSIDARLRAKMHSLADHDVTIESKWIHEQDQELVKPGGVFYLTLYKLTKRGTLNNSQELRFRRTVAWAPSQIEETKKAARELLKKIRTRPSLDESH